MTIEEFDKLTEKEQQQQVTQALAWFCVFEAFNKYFRTAGGDELDVIKIVLGKFRE